MADLDVSDLCVDPDLADSFDVTRRPYAANTFGEGEVTPTVHAGVVGVVCYASPNDLQRLPEEQRQGRVLSIVSPFRFYGPSQDGAQQYQPDLITWRGGKYVVAWIDPYTNFGAGQCQILAPSFDPTLPVTT